MTNPRLSDISEQEQNLLYEKLNAYNRNKASFKEAGCYFVVLPREGHPNYSLWFYTPLLERRAILYLEELNPEIVPSLRLVTSQFWYVSRPVLVTEYNEKRMTHNGDDLVPFGKYRGHFLYEILKIDPQYVNWIALKFTARTPKQERFVKMAQAYNIVQIDRAAGKLRQVQPVSHYLGVPGEKMGELTLKVITVRLEDDPYKTHIIGTTPMFYVRQHLTSMDAKGNRVNITLPAAVPSQVSGQLPASEHAYKPGDILHIASARVASTYESRGIRHTRLNYVRFHSSQGPNEK